MTNDDLMSAPEPNLEGLRVGVNQAIADLLAVVSTLQTARVGFDDKLELHMAEHQINGVINQLLAFRQHHKLQPPNDDDTT